MFKKLVLALSISALCAGMVFPGYIAVASVSNPFQSSVEEREEREISSAKNRNKSTRVPNSYYSRLKTAVLAKFRPSENSGEIDFDAAERLLNQKTFNQKVFNEEFQEQMKKKYADRVAPYEKTATDPIWRARYWEMDRYENGRKDVAKWTAQEALENQLRDFVRGGDQNSAPIKIFNTANDLTGANREEAKRQEAQKERKRQAQVAGLPTQEEEEPATPTRLVPKLNLLKVDGSVVFSNPIATTAISGNRNDGFRVGMDREFRKLSLRSNLSYVVKEECLNVNLNKQLTEQVSLDLDHTNYTGSKRGGSGEKSREQARVNYNISF